MVSTSPSKLSSLQGMQLRGAELTGMPHLQPFDNCRCFQLARWATLQQGLNLLLPNPVEEVGPGAPPAILTGLRRQRAALPLARRSHAHPSDGGHGDHRAEPGLQGAQSQAPKATQTILDRDPVQATPGSTVRSSRSPASAGHPCCSSWPRQACADGR